MRILCCLCAFLPLFITGGPVLAEEAGPDTGAPALTLNLDEEVALDDDAEAEEDAYRPHWYFGLGSTNYHPRLRESEGQIDRQLNRVFGWLPSWEEPTTFADWRDDFMLWDGVAGFGRDLTPKTTLMVWFGGAMGSITSREQYGLISTKINFKRTSLFLTPEIFYYPLGKIDYGVVEGTRGFDRVRAALSGTKPYLSFVAGYSFVRAEADVKFKAPLLGTLLRQKQCEDDDMMSLSPRIGLDIPIGRNTSLAPVLIYLFQGPAHFTEYSGLAFSFTVRRRF